MIPADVILFPGLAGWQIAGLCLAYAGAFLVKGVFGYGAVPPIILVGSLLMDPHEAVILAGLVNLASQLFLLPQGIRTGDRALAGRLTIFILPALAVGVVIFARLPTEGLQVTVGAGLLTILLLEGSPAWRRLEPIAARRHGAFSAVAAVITGLLSGIVGAGAMIFLSVYLRTRLSDRLTFRGTVILIMTAILVWRTLLFLGAGLVDMAIALQALVLLPAAAAGLVIGTRLVRTTSDAIFFTAYRFFLIAASLLLIARGLI